MEGLLPGEVAVVLDRPGSGWWTFLKTIASQMYGFQVDSSSVIFYISLAPKNIEKDLKGDVTCCCSENEVP